MLDFTDPVIIAIFTLIPIIGILGYVYIRKSGQRAQSTSTDVLNQRIAVLQEGFVDQGKLEERDSDESFFEALNKDTFNLIGSFAPTPSEELTQLLNKAGERDKYAYLRTFFQQIIGGIFGFTIGVCLIFVMNNTAAGLALGLGIGFLFYSGVKSGLRTKAKDRSYKIDKTLPDVIDLFANCCVAGVSFDTAANYILNDLGSELIMKPIKEDMLAWQADVNLGMTRPEGWKRLSDRSDSKNIRYFTSLINQSEKTGGSVADALFKMSSFFRERRKQLLEAEIAQLPTKMSSQTIVFIVMPMVVLLMAPVGLNAFRMVSEIF